MTKTTYKEAAINWGLLTLSEFSRLSSQRRKVPGQSVAMGYIQETRAGMGNKAKRPILLILSIIAVP